MSGIRIRHGTRRNQILPVPLLHKPHPWNTNQCGACERIGLTVVHPCKVLHLQLDPDGCTIVSREIWADLQQTTDCGGFRVTNLVPDPPAQTFTPPTSKLRIEAAPIGVTPDGEVIHGTVEEFVDAANARGIDTATAINRLVAEAVKHLTR